jgi:hypothetical protein
MICALSSGYVVRESVWNVATLVPSSMMPFEAHHLARARAVDVRVAEEHVVVIGGRRRRRGGSGDRRVDRLAA